jgi:hypothetical protein
LTTDAPAAIEFLTRAFGFRELERIEEIVSGLIACGLSASQAADGYRAVWQFTVGELIIRRGLERTATLGHPPFVVAYDIGLSALLDGLLRDPA